MNIENKLLKEIRKADKMFNLISDNDNILIGVSGGKDSIVLLDLLLKYKKFNFKNINIIACYINVGFENMNIDILKKYCDKNDIKLIIEDTNILNILHHYNKNGKISCARCSNLKRGAIINVAKKYNCNKVAFAHHADDAIETYIMNQIVTPKLDVLKPIINYNDNNILFIRPLYLCFEKEIEKYQMINCLPVIKNNCPNDNNSKRYEIKQDLKKIYKKYPLAQKNLLKCCINLYNIKKEEIIK